MRPSSAGSEPIGTSVADMKLTINTDGNPTVGTASTASNQWMADSIMNGRMACASWLRMRVIGSCIRVNESQVGAPYRAGATQVARQVTRQVAGQVMVFNRLIHTIIKFWMGRVSGGVRRVDKRPEARIHRCMVQVPPSRSLTLRITLVRRIFVTGIQFFRRTEKTFADVI